MRLVSIAWIVMLLALGACAPSTVETTLWRDAATPSNEATTDAALELSVLTYNIKGLPGWVLEDDPDERILRIGRLANRYDIALFQEDYLHHQALLETARHPFAARGNGPRSRLASLVPFLCGSCGSGLSAFAKISPEQLVEVRRQAFGPCVGWFDDANDCWANKGYMSLRLRLAEGIELDVYTLHLESGRGARDQYVRSSQLAQLREDIESYSAGRPVILAGDFNLNWFNAFARDQLAAFATSLKLRESGARWAGSRPAIWLDYILYRNGACVRLDLEQAGEATEFEFDGKPLSDHPAVMARFRIEGIPCKSGG